MSFIEHAIQSFQRQPRALQWSIAAGIGMVLFLVWDSGIAPITAQWKSAADDIQAKLQQVRAGSRLIDRFDALENEITGIGMVELPTGKKQGQETIQEAINEILRNHSVSDQSFATQEGRVPNKTLTSVVGSKRLESLKVDLDFTATPEEAMAIIAEIEANPNIEFISTIRMNKAPGQKIKVRMTFEKWVLGSKT